MSKRSTFFTLLGCIVATAPFTGCRDFGTGGTGELVVPTQRLRLIEATDLTAAATTQPATQNIPLVPPSTAPAPAEMTLGIEEVRRIALENNLDLRVQLLTPEIQRTSIGEERGRFEAVFRTSAQESITDRPTASQLNSSEAKVTSVAPSVELPLVTGGSIQFEVPFSRVETDNSFSTLNPSYETHYQASISLPLMRGAGIDANAIGLRVAFYETQATEARTKLEIIRIIADIERLYWRLYAARKGLEVRKKEYDLAVAQLERAKRVVRAGSAAEVEVISAESGVADRLEGIITADNLVRQRQRDLKRALHMPGLDLGSPTTIVPGTLPKAQYFRLSPDDLAVRGLTGRMELLESEINIARDSANVASAKNALLPLVSLTYTYGMNGLGSTPGTAFGQSTDNEYVDHTIGLQVEVPLGNESARSRLRRAIGTRLQTLATRDQRIAQIRQEIYDAVDAIDTNWQRILAAQRRVILSARTVDGETRQFDLGLRTSTDVLDAQTRLANAQLAEITAVTDYQVAQIDIAFATGTLLGAANVSWAPTPLPNR